MTQDKHSARVGFILGILRRSGTNFLYRLLCEHPDCVGMGPIGEDFLIHHADLLDEYVKRVKGSWNVAWRAHTLLEGRDRFCTALGDAILGLIREQAERARIADGGSPFMAASGAGTRRPVVLTKTPSVMGIANFFRFFEDAPLILLVRDGRAVVESGVRSFGWDYEKATREWAGAARRILAVQRMPEAVGRVKIVRYEDLLCEGRRTVGDLLDFMGLDRNRYPFDRLDGVAVIGSSDLAKAGSLHWNDVPKPARFDPVRRFEEWDRGRHRCFNWLAGREMRMLGYELAYDEGPAWRGRCWRGWRDGCWAAHTLAHAAVEFARRLPCKARAALGASC